MWRRLKKRGVIIIIKVLKVLLAGLKWLVGADPGFWVRGGEVRRGPQSDPGRNLVGDPGTKIPGSSYNLAIFGPKIVHFHVNFTFPYQNCSYHEKLRKDIHFVCTTIILLSEVSFDDEPRKFCVFATTKYELTNSEIRNTSFLRNLEGGGPLPLWIRYWLVWYTFILYINIGHWCKVVR